MSKREFPDDFPEWVGDVQAAAKMLISHPTTKVDYRISVEKLMTLGSGIKTITIDDLSELDGLAEGAYIIKGAAQGLLVVVDDVPAYQILIEYSNFAWVRNEAGERSGFKKRASKVILSFYEKGIFKFTVEREWLQTEVEIRPLIWYETDANYLARWENHFLELNTEIDSYFPAYSGLLNFIADGAILIDDSNNGLANNYGVLSYAGEYVTVTFPNPVDSSLVVQVMASRVIGSVTEQTLFPLAIAAGQTTATTLHRDLVDMIVYSVAPASDETYIYF